ncbi:MAG: peptidylprolyl isomerase [Gemmatimonadetes bacterium]|nr:peptidylprolyl isomerase [Gemmatimonadota bacterium]
MKSRMKVRGRVVLGGAMAAIVVAAMPAGAQTQTSDPTLVDQIVAVVGDSVILRSQLDEQKQMIELQGGNVPSGGPALDQFYKDLLNSLINQVLVIQAAAKDTLVKADDAQVSQIVNDEIERRSQSAGGGPAFQQALQREGFTLAEYRDYLTSQVRQDQIKNMFLQRRLQNAPPVEVSNDELLAAFDEARNQVAQRPRTISFHQVVIAPSPSDAEWEAAKEKAQGILDRIRAGEDFAKLAKEYSQDPGSAQQGGDLGWFRRGTMVKAFEDVAFGLYDGAVSGLVKTEYGYHIIKLERSRPGERQARHILIRPQMSAGDADAAQLRADSVADQARAGVSMDSLYDRYSDPQAPDTLTVVFDKLNQLPPSYAQALQTASTGDVLGPLQYATGAGETRYAVVKVGQIREAGAYTFEEMKGQLAQTLRQNKQIEKILEDLKQKTYIDIRM